MHLFLVTLCHVVAVQPCMEWMPIKKNCSFFKCFAEIFQDVLVMFGNNVVLVLFDQNFETYGSSTLTLFFFWAHMEPQQLNTCYCQTIRKQPLETTVRNFFLCTRGVLRTESNIEDGDFCENSLWLKNVSYIHKKLHLRCLTEFWIRPCLLNPVPRNWSKCSSFWNLRYIQNLSLLQDQK